MSEFEKTLRHLAHGLSSSVDFMDRMQKDPRIQASNIDAVSIFVGMFLTSTSMVKDGKPIEPAKISMICEMMGRPKPTRAEEDLISTVLLEKLDELMEQKGVKKIADLKGGDDPAIQRAIGELEKRRIPKKDDKSKVVDLFRNKEADKTEADKDEDDGPKTVH